MEQIQQALFPWYRLAWVAANFYGDDPVCILGLAPDGWIGAYLVWDLFKRQRKRVRISLFDIKDPDPDLEITHGFKVLLVDNDTHSGKTYLRAKEILKEKAGLKEQDIRLLVLDDFAGVADFYKSRER